VLLTRFPCCTDSEPTQAGGGAKDNEQVGDTNAKLKFVGMTRLDGHRVEHRTSAHFPRGQDTILKLNKRLLLYLRHLQAWQQNLLVQHYQR
jgi:hypothetical protein